VTWLEIIWCFFWRSLALRMNEEPQRAPSRRLPEPAPQGEAAWKESMDMVSALRGSY
jgi:hypothetical protein